MNDNLKKMARAGYVAKGSVYGITGILTFLAAFNLGGEKTSQLEVLKFLDEQPFGNVLLALLGVGLIFYAAWRYTQSIEDPEGIGEDKKGKVKRVAFFISGTLYLGLGAMALWRVIGSGAGSGGSGSGNSAQNSSILDSENGLIALGIIGAAIVGTGIYQFIRIYKADFMKKFDFESISEEKRRKTIKNSAYVGMASRGVLFLIIGYFALHAAITSNPSDIKTTRDAFSFLEDSSYGAWLLGIVAAGLVGYAVYMFMMARYRHFRG
ncbi:DUF1206 domain-containing protein [Antarcticibacterium flavum]|uniref:DUF1206 domain-containing protein n=1 Tax=Antarcticibacterium flavum TaxID=2058175 RepID=A0A5B7WXS7_9FLAO|nr:MULTISPECIES: DUF1206 domain-containing protein [Antarcticibacterium]MCM4160788.1 DUF1206 domain-containing protein [Antarcticibacterium sp. W02-3]QCY67959.1 DUF1206 domain-containing protein [Antarcticibacterium flavum]